MWDNSPSTGNDRIVLVYLADQANDDGIECYPSVERIADRCRIQRGTVLACIKRLEGAGELLVQRPEKQGRGRFNRYAVVMGRPVDDVATLLGITPVDEPKKGARSVPFLTSGKARSETEKGAMGGLFGRDLIAPDSSLRIDPKPSRPKDIRVDNESFDAFWAVYPRRVEKPKARSAWAKASQRADPERIIDGARRYATDPNRQDAYTKHPASWLNADCWDDEPLPRRAVRPQAESTLTQIARLAQREEFQT